MRTKTLALINPSRSYDCARDPHWNALCAWLSSQQISYIDYASGRITHSERVDGINAAVADDRITDLWSVCGGTESLNMLEDINWHIIADRNLSLIGSSDFTHLALIAAQYNIPCWYGPSALSLIKHYPPEARSFFYNFIRTGTAQENYALLNAADFPNAEPPHYLVGGHSMISAILLPHIRIQKPKWHLFFEHHYRGEESIADVTYFLRATIRLATSKPSGILLGHSKIIRDGQLMPHEQILQELANNIADLNLPLWGADHYTTVIPLHRTQST